MQNIKAIIFDMDGVLVDSEPLHQKVEFEVCREFGMKVREEELDRFRGTKLEDIYSFVIKKYGTGNESIEKMIERKIEIYLKYALREMKLIEGVSEFLEKLRASGKYSYALTTSGRKVQQDQILAKVKLDKFFPIIVTADDVTRGKPDPEAYLITTEKLKELPENCLVIEDSDNGIISAKAAGCQTCGIPTSLPRECLEKAGADLIVSNFKELEKILF